MDIAVIFVIDQYWSCDQGHLFALQTLKNAPQRKMAQIYQNVKEKNMIKNKLPGRADNFLGPMFW